MRVNSALHVKRNLDDITPSGTTVKKKKTVTDVNIVRDVRCRHMLYDLPIQSVPQHPDHDYFTHWMKCGLQSCGWRLIGFFES